MRRFEHASEAERRHADRAMNFYDEVRRFEIKLIRWALEQTHGKQVDAARLLGIKNTTLNTKIKQYDLSANRRAAPAGGERGGETTCSPHAG